MHPAPCLGGGVRRPTYDERVRSVDRHGPFARLAATHAFGMAGEATLALALAGTLFFEVDPAEGREKVLLGLILTMTPFALVGPLIGPMVDRVRGGHRAVIIGSMVLRTLIAVVMVPSTANESLLLFPQAFLMLVLAKTYQVSKAAVVPQVIEGQRNLVEANSKLQLLGGLAGFATMAPAGLCYLIGPGWVMGWCAICFAGASVAAWTLEAGSEEPDGSGDAQPVVDQAAEARSAAGAVAVAGEAASMAVIRAAVGFSTFVLAFELRSVPDVSRSEQLARNAAEHLPGVAVPPVTGEFPTWYFGVVVAMGVVGGLVGSTVSPRLRAIVAEERILLGALGVVALAGLWGIVFDGLLAFSGLALGVAVAAATGKQAFDAIVQKETPSRDRGRLFAVLESRFQVAWVIGGLIPVAIELSVGAGSVVVAAVAALAIAAAITGRFGQPSKPSGESGTSISPKPSTSV